MLATYRNLFLTMLLGGIWHGAAWNFIIWGIIHGTALISERIVKGLFTADRAAALAMAGPARGSLSAAAVPEPKQRHWLASVFGVLITFHIVCLAWIFFRAENLNIAWMYLAGLADWTQPNQHLQPFMVFLVGGSLLGHFLPNGWVTGCAKKLEGYGPLVHGAALGFGILLIELIAPEGVAPFIYFQF